MTKHFISLKNLDPSQLDYLIKSSEYYRLDSDQNSQPLQKKVIANVFYEPSTRTRFSFEIAAKKLGAHVLNFSLEGSSVKKGESINDTLKTMESMGVNCVVLRHSDDHIFDQVKDKFNLSIINAGSGKNEHPSQCLLDLFTLKQEFNYLEGRKIAVCGDIKHSRVVGSLKLAAQKLNFELYFCGPSELVTQENVDHLRIRHFDDILPEVDAVMMLRIQLERHQHLELESKTYHQQYGLTLSRVHRMKKSAIILHPGPFNRGVEIADEVIEHPQSRIFKQVENGVYCRMAILDWALNGMEINS